MMHSYLATQVVACYPRAHLAKSTVPIWSPVQFAQVNQAASFAKATRRGLRLLCLLLTLVILASVSAAAQQVTTPNARRPGRPQIQPPRPPVVVQPPRPPRPPVRPPRPPVRPPRPPRPPVVIVRPPRPVPVAAWRLIAQTQARRTIDHDGVLVGNSYYGFRYLKLRVWNAPLNLLRLVVTYENGQSEDIAVRYGIPAGGETRPISLVGGRRRIRRIDFWYNTSGWRRGRATVAVYGLI